MMRTTRWAVAAVLLVPPCGLVAQGATPPPSGSTVSDEELRQRIETRVKAMREAIRDGLPITTSVRVTVNLRNAHRIKGVVKNGRFVEKVHGLDFVASDMQAPGSGIRVWYYNDTNSFVFLPFEAITSYKIGVRLTEVQIQEIEARIERTQAEARVARQQELARREQGDAENERKEGEAELVRTEGEKAAAEAAKKKEEARLLALLEEFPPQAGWGEERAKEIQSRKITIGAYPDKQSERFVQVFEDWKRAVRLKEEKEVPAQPGPPEAPSPPKQ